MKVYRIERRDGKGPYQSSLIVGFNSYVHPSPSNDGIEYNKDYHFGFKDLSQLTAWFDRPTRLICSVNGYDISVYNVPDEKVLHGRRQVAFVRTDLWPVRRRCALTFKFLKRNNLGEVTKS